LEQVLPHLVKEVQHPAQYDSLGVETAPAVNGKAVHYVGLIPYSIGAINEQQSTITQLTERIAVLEEQVAACCYAAGSDGQRANAGGTPTEDLRHTDLFIIPNPVADLTRLRYTIATPGRTRLEVADANGRVLEVLEEAVREVGAFEYGWNTQGLAPGSYHCTLYLNDALVVKKAVKL